MREAGRKNPRRRLAILPIWTAAVLSVACASAQPPETEDRHPCSGAVYRSLDFWLGSWRVESLAGKLQGTNLIEPTADGCAVRESWTGAGGGQGQSLFYFSRPENRWKQVWVTGTGFVKEKMQVIEHEGPGVRFQGEVEYPGRGTLLDRTTLTPGEDGTVRQVIEVSEDGGASWRVTFDGIYRPALDQGSDEGSGEGGEGAAEGQGTHEESDEVSEGS